MKQKKKHDQISIIEKYIYINKHFLIRKFGPKESCKFQITPYQKFQQEEFHFNKKK